MYLIAIAWIYVALMMALAEATHPQGSVLGAVFTFMLYGVGPMALVMYLLGTPMRREARKKQEAREELAAQAEPEPQAGAASIAEPDQGGHAPGAGVAPEGKVP